MTMIGIYLRVSSDKQDMEAQEPELKAWAERQKEEVRWYSDTFTGKRMDRPGFAKLYKDVCSGKVRTLAVWRLDRLGRTAAGLTKLFDELIERKVNFISLKDGIDLATAAGRLMANVLASVAQYETEIRAERIKAGLDAKRDRGEAWGNGRKPGSYTKATLDVRQAVREQAERGTAKSSIAKMFHLSRQTVYTILAEGN